jgi:hypothetical protein
LDIRKGAGWESRLFLLLVERLEEPRLGRNELLRGDAELEELGDDGGEAIAKRYVGQPGDEARKKGQAAYSLKKRSLSSAYAFANFLKPLSEMMT